MGHVPRSTGWDGIITLYYYIQYSKYHTVKLSVGCHTLTHILRILVSRRISRRLKRQKRKKQLPANKRLGRINFPRDLQGQSISSIPLYSIHTYTPYVCPCRAGHSLPLPISSSAVCPWLSPFPVITVVLHIPPFWPSLVYGERTRGQEWTWAMHVCPSVHTAQCIHTYIVHTSTLYPPSRALSIIPEWQILYAWPHLFLPCQSYFPRLFADPLQDIELISIPYIQYSIQRQFWLRLSLIQGGMVWLYGVWCEQWVRRLILHTYSFSMEYIPPFPCPENPVLFVLLSLNVAFGITITPTHSSIQDK